jgi:hypothetical protein
VSAGTVILLVIVLLVIAVAAGLASTAARRRASRRRTGAEYGGPARGSGSRRARAELAARRRRVDAMGIKPLSAERRSGYERQWTAAQERFIDSPAQAVTSAAGLVTAVATERGYDVSDADQLLADLSVHHGGYLDGYRSATRTTGRAATAATEELRQALLGHRALFRDLLTGPSSADGRGRTAAAGRPAAGGGRPDGWRQAVPSPHRPGRRPDPDRDMERDMDKVPAAGS